MASASNALGWLVLAAVAACGSRAQLAAGDGDEPMRGAGSAGAGTVAVGGSPAGPRPAQTGGTTSSASSGAPAQAGGNSSGDANEAGAPGSGPGGAAGEGGGGAELPEPPSCDPIVFDDPELEQHVALSVGKASGPLSAADVVGLTALITVQAGSLKGVECLTQLTDLDVGIQPAGHVTDLSPLANLQELQAVSVGRNPLQSLEPLGRLPKLEYLFIARAPVVLDLAPLASSKSLSYLDLEGDTVQDLRPLGSIPSLRTLLIRQGHVLHPEGAAALTNLRDLDATGVFDDVSPLAGLAQLERLRVSQRTIHGFEALSGLVSLRLLDITRTGVDDLAPIAGMTNLVVLGAVGNGISDVSPLRSLPNLQSVALVENQIADVRPLLGNAGLGTGDFIYLQQNELVCGTQAASLQALRARGAVVESDCD